MIFKKRTVTFVSLIYGYEKENDAEYCLSFVTTPSAKVDGFCAEHKALPTPFNIQGSI